MGSSLEILARTQLDTEQLSDYLTSKIEDKLKNSEKLSPSDWNYYSAVMNGSNSANQGTIENHPYKFRQDITAYAESLSDVDELVAIQDELRNDALPDLSSHNSQLAYWLDENRYTNSDVRLAETKLYSEHISELNTTSKSKLNPKHSELNSEHISELDISPFEQASSKRSRFGSVLKTLGKVAAGIMVPLATVYGAVALSHAHANDPTKKFGKDSLEKIIKYQAQDNNSTNNLSDANYSIIKLAENVTTHGVDINNGVIAWDEENSVMWYNEKIHTTKQLLSSGIEPMLGENIIFSNNAKLKIFNYYGDNNGTTYLDGNAKEIRDSSGMVIYTLSEGGTVEIYNISGGTKLVLDSSEYTLELPQIKNPITSPGLFKDRAFYTIYNEEKGAPQFIIKNLTTNYKQISNLTPWNYGLDGKIIADTGAHVFSNNPDFQANQSNYSKQIVLLDIETMLPSVIPIDQPVERVDISGSNLAVLTKNGSAQSLWYKNITTNKTKWLFDTAPGEIVRDFNIEEKSIIWNTLRGDDKGDISFLDMDSIRAPPLLNYFVQVNLTSSFSQDLHNPLRDILGIVTNDTPNYINSKFILDLHNRDNISVIFRLKKENDWKNEEVIAQGREGIYTANVLKNVDFNGLLYNQSTTQNASVIKFLQYLKKDSPNYFLDGVTVEGVSFDIKDVRLPTVFDNLPSNLSNITEIIVASQTKGKVPSIDVYDSNLERLLDYNNDFFYFENGDLGLALVFNSQNYYLVNVTGKAGTQYDVLHNEIKGNIAYDRASNIPITSGVVHQYNTSLALSNQIPKSRTVNSALSVILNKFLTNEVITTSTVLGLGAGSGIYLKKRRKDRKEARDILSGNLTLHPDAQPTGEEVRLFNLEGEQGFNPLAQAQKYVPEDVTTPLPPQLPTNPTSPVVNIPKDPTAPEGVLDLFEGFDSKKEDDLPEMED